MDANIVIPVVAIVFGCGIPLSAIWTEHLRDKALIEKGLYQPKQPSAYPGWGLLLAGSIVTGIGMALRKDKIKMQNAKFLILDFRF